MIAEAENTHLKAVELNKFVHYYTRFKNHENSFKIEEPLLALARTKLEILTARQSVKKTTSPTRSEKEKDLKQQLQALQENDLLPIYCMGESEKEKSDECNLN